MPEEEQTVVRAVPERILALSRVTEIETKTIPVPRELLELSRREQSPPRAVECRRAEPELVWDAWYGSAAFQMDSEEPVFELRPSQRVSRSARRVAARAAVLMLAALCVAATYWGIQ